MDELATLIQSILSAETDEQRREALADVDLDATETQLREAGNELLANGGDSPEDLETLGAIADVADFVRAEKARRAEETATKDAAKADLVARLNGTPEAEEVDEGADEDAELAVSKPAADDQVAGQDPNEPDADDAAKKKGGRKVAKAAVEVPSLDTLRRLQPVETQPVETAAAKVKITAAADVPGRNFGADYHTPRELTEALIARQEMLGNGRSGNASMEKIAVVRVDYLDELRKATEDKMLNGLMLRDAGLSDALTASGGFCAPSQIVYDFVKINRPSDLTQDFLPTVGTPRGSIEYPDSPDIRDAFSGNLTRAYTNQNDIDSVEKVTAIIACPSFNTCTVGAQYVILQFGNFGTRAYPEWVEHWVGLSMDAHAHKVSEKLVTQMVALSNAGVVVGPSAGATATLLSNFAMAAADYRQDLRTGRDAQLDIVFPSWTYDLIRSDLARARKGRLDETLNVSDAAINAWIGSHNLTPHTVTDWQDISGNSATGTTVWPSGVEFMIYAPGTFVKLDMGTLDLGIVRDSVLNATNDYNIFVETFESVCKPGIESRLYTANLCVDGAFAADQNISCAGLDIPGS